MSTLTLSGGSVDGSNCWPSAYDICKAKLVNKWKETGAGWSNLIPFDCRWFDFGNRNSHWRQKYFFLLGRCDVSLWIWTEGWHWVISVLNWESNDRNTPTVNPTLTVTPNMWFVTKEKPLRNGTVKGNTFVGNPFATFSTPFHYASSLGHRASKFANFHPLPEQRVEWLQFPVNTDSDPNLLHVSKTVTARSAVKSRRTVGQNWDQINRHRKPDDCSLDSYSSNRSN